MSSFEKLKALTSQITTHETTRKQNLRLLKELFTKLDIGKKHENFDTIFDYSAINLSGISLQTDTLCQPREKRYAQIIGIRSVDDRGVKRPKNSNLAYFGRAENLQEEKRAQIAGFVLRWRYEKSFHNLEHYSNLIDALGKV